MAPGANPPTAVIATIMMNHAAATTYAIAFVSSVTCAKPTSTATSMTAMAERTNEPMMSNMATSKSVVDGAQTLTLSAGTRSVLSMVKRGVAQEQLRQAPRVGKRDEMTALDRIDVHGQPLAGDATLELEGKQAIVAASDDMDRNAGPGVEGRGMFEDLLGLSALMRFTLL